MITPNADGEEGAAAAAAASAEELFDSEEGVAGVEPKGPSPATSRVGRRPPTSSSVVVSMLRADKNLPRVQDHFSLPAPSSEVRFRRSNVRVYEQPNMQFVLQEHATAKSPTTTSSSTGATGGGGAGGSAAAGGGDDQKQLYITVKQTSDVSYGLTFLRATYSLVAVFIGGFLFIFALELLLFLFIDLATALGVTHTRRFDVAAFIGVLLSIPVFVYSLAIFMAIITRFVVDTWSGHPFLRTFGRWSVVVTDWVAFILYLGIPLLTFICTLMMKLDDWWAISILTWFTTVILFWAFFAGCVIFYELDACLHLIGEANERAKDPDMGLFAKIKLAIVHGMRARLAGVKKELYMVDGNMVLPDDGCYTDSDVEPRMVSTGLYSRMTQLKYLRCIYETLDPPQRKWTIDEVRGNVPFVTRYSWSLEKLFCKGGWNSSIPVVAGPSAITRHQAMSSFVCALLGDLLFLLLVVGLLVWFGIAGAGLAIVIVLIVLCCIPEALQVFRIMRIYRDAASEHWNEDEDDEDEYGEVSEREGVSTAIYHLFESWNLTKPTAAFAWITIALQFLFLYVWPLAYLCLSKNVPSATLFAFLGLFSGIRHYLNPSVLLQDIGHFASVGLIEGETQKHKGLLGVKTKREWEAKSRLSEIVGIGSDRSRRFWNMVFGLLVIFYVFVVLAAVTTTTDETIESDGMKEANDQYVLLSGFEYKPRDHLPYPTCVLKKGLEIPDAEAYEGSTLSDVAFFAGLAYVKAPDAQYLLDQWMGENGAATDNVEVVDEFKIARSEYAQSPASYKLITFRDAPHFAVVTIRGTATLWDMMADAQLWLAAVLFQGLRELLPLGEVWTPVLHKMIRFVSALESESINKVAFYKETTQLIEYLKENTEFTTIHVTGHSLGGGLALISGSQTNTSAVGLSAPNAMLSRETFDPPLTVKSLNTLTFNIVPVGDVIPMLDDKANLYQNIECNAAANDIIGCHSPTRSFCEIMYTCGSSGRPVVCNCTSDYGYPEPTPTGNQTTNFTIACRLAAAKAASISN